MKIYIELVVFFILLIMFVWWGVWINVSRKKILKKYKPENNLSGENNNEKEYKGGIFNGGKGTGRTATAEPRVESAPGSIVRPEQSERRELLSETTVDDAGKDSNSTRENSSTIRRRRFFGRRRRRK